MCVTGSTDLSRQVGVRGEAASENGQPLHAHSDSLPGARDEDQEDEAHHSDVPEESDSGVHVYCVCVCVRARARVCVGVYTRSYVQRFIHLHTSIHT